MEKVILKPSSKMFVSAIISCIFLAMMSMLCLLEFADSGWKEWILFFFCLLMVAGVIYYIRIALRLARRVVIMDKESITLFECATRIEEGNMRVDVGTITLKWNEIVSIEQRLIKTNSKETYSDDALFGNFTKFNPNPKASAFGKKGWNEIVRYYNEYKGKMN